MQPSAKKELAMFVVSCAVFLGYHVWLFAVRPRWRYRTKKQFNVWGSNQQARKAWAVEVSGGAADSLQTYAVQTLRNSITAASFLATACSLIAVTGIGNTILDGNKVARLEAIARGDPVLDGGSGVFSATTKLGITEAMVLFSFLCLTQSIRLQVHMAFYAKVIASEHNKAPHAHYCVDELVAMSKRAALCWALGLRAFYAFIPLLLWALGPTWMLSATLIEVLSLIVTDSLPLPKRLPYEESSAEKEADLEQGGGQPAAPAGLHKRGKEGGAARTGDQPALLGD